MADQAECPRCHKSITPYHCTITRSKPLDRSLIAQELIVGLLFLTTGLILLIFSHDPLSGILFYFGIPFVLVSLSVFLHLLNYVQGAKYKQTGQKCPACRYSWPAGLKLELKKYFTNFENLRDEFRSYVTGSAAMPSQRLLIISGEEGQGKSALLQLFQLICVEEKVPVALASGDHYDTSAFVDVLSHWEKQIAFHNIKLPTFSRLLDESRSEEARTVFAELLGRVVKAGGQNFSKPTALPEAGATLLGEAISVRQPDKARKKQVIPIAELIESFCNDITERVIRSQAATPQRVFLLLDAIDTIDDADQSVCYLIQKLPPQVLLVVAARKELNWSQSPDCRTFVRVAELEKISEETAREMANQYAKWRGKELTDSQREKIVRLAQRMPLALAVIMLVDRFADDMQEQDIHSVETDIVDLLIKGMPEQMQSLLKAAATLRYFNKEILDAVIGETTPQHTFENLLLYRSCVGGHEKKGYSLQLYVRNSLDKYLETSQPTNHQEMHQRAADYFKRKLEKAERKEVEGLRLEWLHHKICINVDDGIKEFRKMAEELVCYQMINQLRTLLYDMSDYLPQEGDENLSFWHQYYSARLKDLEGAPSKEVEQIYQEIADNEQAEEMLRAYALCDWAWIARQKDPGYMEQILDRICVLIPDIDKLDRLPEADAKLGLYHLALGELYKLQGRCKESLNCLKQAQKLYEKSHDTYWLAYTHNRIKYYYLERGIWKEAKEREQRGLNEVSKLKGEQERSYIKGELLFGGAVYWIWAGLYQHTDARLENVQKIAKQQGRDQQRAYFLRDLGVVLGLQGKTEEADQYFDEGIRIGEREDPLYKATVEGFRGLVALKWKGVELAEKSLSSGWDQLHSQTKRKWDEPAFLNWRGMLYEVKGEFEKSKESYKECLSPRLLQLEVWYWLAGALTGLVRVHYAMRGDLDIDSLQEAESLAQLFEYNDHMASLRLIQGHVAWDGQITSRGQGFDAALSFYKDALVYALRYNRFLLDEMLSGRSQETPFQPIIPHCQNRKDNGERMLQALREWWQKGTNLVGIPRGDSISPIREGDSLLECENQARKGSEHENRLLHWDQIRHLSVIDQIDRVMVPVPF